MYVCRLGCSLYSFLKELGVDIPGAGIRLLTHTHTHCLNGLVVKASALRAEDLGFESLLRQDFSRSGHTSDSKIGTPVSTLPDAWCYWVSAGTGQPGVSILWLGETESLMCSFYLGVQHVNLSEQNRPWDTLACCWDVKYLANKHTDILAAREVSVA